MVIKWVQYAIDERIAIDIVYIGHENWGFKFRDEEHFIEKNYESERDVEIRLNSLGLKENY